MIPTRSKSKLPKTLSYPLGAEEISQALAETPQVEEIRLSFHGLGWPASEFQRVLREGLPYGIMEAAYTPPRSPGYSGANFMVETGWYDAKWSLMVYPVLRERRRLAHGLLVEHGLPIVAEWLRDSNQAGWENCQHNIELVLDPANESLSVRRNERV
jgi:hypothetical protein